MAILAWSFISVLLMVAVGFTVRGPSAPLVAPLGSSVVLPCYITDLSLMEGLEVQWRRTDSETLVHLYQDGEGGAEAQQQDYHDRAHFFTEEIQRGNFSLRLDDLRAEDNGVYRCKVYSQQEANKTLVELKVVERLLVSGSDESISASVGEDVTLTCSVNSHITPEHFKEVSWKKTDKDGDILVLLYENNETLSDSSDERYRDRVEFFTAEIPKGNFSLRLKRVRTEDKGVYMCLVFAGDLSANATVELERLGFSGSLIVLLTLCVGSDAALLLHWLYYKSKNDDTSLFLQTCLSFGLNITMLLASIIWHFTEGFFYETIPCCVFYIMGPMRLLWVTPYEGFPDKILTSHADHVAFMVSMYSVLLAEHFQNINMVLKTAAFALLVLMCLLFITRLVKENLVYKMWYYRICCKVQQLGLDCCFSLLPALQLALLLYYYFAHSAVFTILPVLPCFHLLFFCCCERANQYLYYLTKLIWIMVIAMGGEMVYLYFGNEKDGTGLICVAGFVQALWVLAFSEVPAYHPNFGKRRTLKKILFIFGSAGLVFVNSAALITEVIAIAVNGKRLVRDLRMVVFPSEGLFTATLLLFSISAPGKTDSPGLQEASQKSADSDRTSDTIKTSVPMTQMKGESPETKNLRRVVGSTEEQEEEIS